MVLCAIGVGLAAMARNESGIAKLKVVSTVSLVLCIAVGVAAVAGASVGFEMGPWYALIEKAQSMGSSDTTLYVK
jgi:hypothetical protein